jgi:hypothetical protein
MSEIPTTFDPPPPKPGELAPPVFEIQYLQSYNYVFENPNWFANIAFVAIVSIVAGLIPFIGGILGQLVILGYSYDLIESLCRTGGRRYPDFAFDRLGDYLLRGLWPFLASLIGSLPTLPVAIGVALAIFGIWGGFANGNVNAFGNTDPSPILIAISVGLGAMTLLVVWIYSFVVVFPMTLRAGLSQDISQAFKFSLVLDFSKKVWFETVLVSLFLAMSLLVMFVAGFLMACVGLYFTMSLASLAQAHLMYQLYQLYLSRGGEPIPLKTPVILAYAPPGEPPFAPPAEPLSPFGPNVPPK